MAFQISELEKTSQILTYVSSSYGAASDRLRAEWSESDRVLSATEEHFLRWLSDYSRSLEKSRDRLDQIVQFHDDHL